MLLHRAQLESSNSAQVDFTGTDTILQVIAFAYPQFPVALKTRCQDQVAALVRMFVDEGPTYLFTPKMMVRLQLLEHLAAIHFLDDSGNLDVTQWTDVYFPECFECCGVVLQLLSEKTDDEKDGGYVGMIRMLDMCLLVIKAVLDYFETRRDDICTLLRILTPTVVTALAQLTNRSTLYAEATASEISEARSVESGLYLLVRMAAVIEERRCDTIVKIFENLLAPTAASCFNATRPTLLSACFDAVHEILVHSSVTEIMELPLAAALQVDNLRALHTQYWMKKQTAEAAYQGTCICFMKTHLRSEGGTTTENSASVAGLPFDMNLDDSKDLTKLAHENRADEIISDQSCASVLRPDAPQWFDEEDSNSDDSGLETNVNVPLQTHADKCERRPVKKPVSQWFDNDVEEDSDDSEMSALPY